MRAIEQIPVLKDNIHSLIEICERHQVSKLFVFGSVITGEFDLEESGIDLIVELAQMSPEEKGDHLIDLWDELEALFQKKVDLLTDQPIKNPFLKESVEKTKLLIYDRERFDQYQSDLKTKSAVERQLSIVGEAVSSDLSEIKYDNRNACI